MTEDNPESTQAVHALEAARNWHLKGMFDTLRETCKCLDNHTWVSKKDPSYVVHWHAQPREMLVQHHHGLLVAEGNVVTIERNGEPVYKVRLKVRRHPMKAMSWVKKQWPKTHFVHRDELYIGLDATISRWEDRWIEMEAPEFYLQLGIMLCE